MTTDTVPSSNFVETEHIEYMKQTAPWPTELEKLVDSFTYRPGWTSALKHHDRDQGSVGLTLIITTNTVNSYPPYKPIAVNHYFIVPAAAYNRQSWMRWLLECCIQVETHEACEFFTIDGEKPFAPHHGPGEDPYQIWVHGTDLQVRTKFTGDINAA